MKLSKYNIKRWFNMFTGRSIQHVNQNFGQVYSTYEIKGYYNDLTLKVLNDLNKYELVIPLIDTEFRRNIEFPIAIFQYGLGSYDLFLIKGNKIFLEKFKLISDWAVKNQNTNGSWDNFSFIYPDNPYSAMAQGEGVSLLIRAYIQFNNIVYLDAAKKAIDFMLLPLEKGGTALYKNEEIIFYEYTHKPPVLNGWIFSLFGLHDYAILTKDQKYQDILNISVKSIKNNLCSFDYGFWSKYNSDKLIASPFYHQLHIAQLKVLYHIYGDNEFKTYYEKWIRNNRNYISKICAVFIKIIQKLKE